MPNSCWIALSFVLASSATSCIELPAKQPPTPSGARVEFYIAADAKDVGARASRGFQGQVQGTDVPPALESTRWIPLDDIEQMYFDSPDELQEAMSDPATYFRKTRGLVVERSGDDFYVLVHTDTPRSMTRTDTPEWNVVGTGITNDNVGYLAVEFELDVAGARRLYDFSSTHVRRTVAIALDGRVYSMPVILSAVSEKAIISGSFDYAEAKAIQDLIRFGEPQGTSDR